MKKEVWYISKYANIKKYGADTRHAHFCKEFAKSGYAVTLLTSNSNHLYDSMPDFKSKFMTISNDGYKVTWVNTLKYAKANGIRRVLSWISFEFSILLMILNPRIKKPDVVIISSLSLLSVLSGSLLKKLFKSKFIFEVRDIWPQSIVDLKGISSRNYFIRGLELFESLGYRYSDAIVGTMPGLKKHVEERVGLGSKVNFVPQGFNSEESHKNEAIDNDFKEKYIPKNKFLVCYAGSIGNANALEYIIEAAKSLYLAGESNVHFLFVGNGYLKSKFEYETLNYENITFAPAIAKSEVQSLLSLCDLLVASVRDEKIYEHGMSLNKFIDYMSSKKPILCMYSGLPSMINEANCGEFVPAENSALFAAAVLRYSKMPLSVRDELGENGYNFINKYRTFNALSKIYMELFK